MNKICTPNWSPYDIRNVIPKEEYVKLRDLATANDIFLSGIKKFDGAIEVVRNSIETLAALKNKFPAISNNGRNLELRIAPFINKSDFAETKGRTIKLNADAYRDVKILETEYQRSVAEGLFVNGTTWQAIIHHEFGHVVANVYKLDPLKIACDVTGLTSKEIPPYVNENLSKYAGAFLNGQEIISEVFAAVSTGNSTEFINKYFDRVLDLTANINVEKIFSQQIPDIKF